MKNPILAGTMGLAVCVLAAPADARRPLAESDPTGGYSSTARDILNFDHPAHWSNRQRSSGQDGEGVEATAPRRQPAARSARRAPDAKPSERKVASRGPDVASRGPDVASPAPDVASPGPDVASPTPGAASASPGVASRGVANIPRGPASGARGCLTAAARALLERIEGQFGPMQIVSTCRPGSRIAGTGQLSKHATGNAIDFNAGARKGEVVRWLIANHKTGGVMTYAGMSHIHVDIGYPFVALNSGGRRR